MWCHATKWINRCAAWKSRSQSLVYRAAGDSMYEGGTASKYSNNDTKQVYAWKQSRFEHSNRRVALKCSQWGHFLWGYTHEKQNRFIIWTQTLCTAQPCGRWRQLKHTTEANRPTWPTVGDGIRRQINDENWSELIPPDCCRFQTELCISDNTLDQ